MVKQRWLVLVLLAALALAGCTARGSSATTDGARAEAMAALKGYLEGRRDNDLSRAYRFLSDASKGLYTEQEFQSYYGQFPVFKWTRVGPVSLVAEDWARIVVYDIASANKQGEPQHLADFAYYVHRQDGRWGVAVINPVLGKLNTAADAQSMLTLSQPLLQANPYSSQIHKELYYAHLAAGDAEQAEAQLRKLYEVSSPSDLATLQVLWSQFFLVTERPDQSIKAAKTAIELAQAYPETYTGPWTSVVLTTQAKAQVMTGEIDAARLALVQAMALDGANLEARALLMELGQPRS